MALGHSSPSICSGAYRRRARGRANATADCDSLCVAAAELVERFELREGAAPVRERAGWERPKKIVVADAPLADYLRTIARKSRSLACRACATTPGWPKSSTVPTC